MTDTANSDYEDKYANESFENDTDEIPEISETESDSENEPATASAMLTTNSNGYAYAQNSFNGRKNSLQNRDYMPYDSSSEDDDDVVISETIAEINTEPMRMEDALLSSRSITQSTILIRRDSSANEKVRLPAAEPLIITELPAVAPSPVSEDDIVDDEVSSEDDDDDDDDDGDDDEDYDDDAVIVEDDDDAIKGGDDDDDDDAVKADDAMKADDDDDNAMKADDDDDDTDKAVGNNSANQEEVKQTEEGELIEKLDNLSFTMVVTPAHEVDQIQLEERITRSPLPVLYEDETLKDKPQPLKRRSASHLNGLNSPSGDKYQKCFDDVPVVGNIGNNCPPKKINNDAMAENESQEPSIDVHITSYTPTSFNSDDYAFHFNFLKQNGSNERLVGIRPHQRKNFSFSNDRLREIERHNHILLRKILSQKPNYNLNTLKSSTKFSTLPPSTRTTSAAVNRKKKQRQIDLDNLGLKRRIEAITLRRPMQQRLNCLKEQ